MITAGHDFCSLTAAHLLPIRCKPTSSYQLTTPLVPLKGMRGGLAAYKFSPYGVEEERDSCS